MYTKPEGKDGQVIWQQNCGLWNNGQPFVDAELFQDNQKTMAMLHMITQVQAKEITIWSGKGEGNDVGGAFSSRVWNFALEASAFSSGISSAGFNLTIKSIWNLQGKEQTAPTLELWILQVTTLNLLQWDWNEDTKKVSYSYIQRSFRETMPLE